MEKLARALVVVVSDRAEENLEGADQEFKNFVRDYFDGLNVNIDGVVLIPVEEYELRSVINTAVIGGVDLVLTIGGVGITPRDIVPQVTADLLDDRLLGIEEAIRHRGYVKENYASAISRGLAGISGGTLIINLASDETSIRDSLKIIEPMLWHIYENSHDL